MRRIDLSELPELPKILSVELANAEAALEKRPKKLVDEYSRRFRLNFLRMLAARGLDTESAEPYVIEPVPFEYCRLFSDLDEAKSKVRHYCSGGEADYVSVGINSYLQGMRASLPNRNKRIERDEVILKFMRSRCYQSSDDKAALVSACHQYLDNNNFTGGESTVRNCLRAAGMTRPKLLKSQR